MQILLFCRAPPAWISLVLSHISSPPDPPSSFLTITHPSWLEIPDISCVSLPSQYTYWELWTETSFQCSLYLLGDSAAVSVFILYSTTCSLSSCCLNGLCLWFLGSGSNQFAPSRIFVPWIHVPVERPRMWLLWCWFFCWADSQVVFLYSTGLRSIPLVMLESSVMSSGHPYWQQKGPWSSSAEFSSHLDNLVKSLGH